MAALSYQIIPTDTQYAEIPLAVVRSCYQKKVKHVYKFLLFLFPADHGYL